MTKKDFEAFAEEISKVENDRDKRVLTLVVSKVALQFNERFDMKRFMERIDKLSETRKVG